MVRGACPVQSSTQKFLKLAHSWRALACAGFALALVGCAEMPKSDSDQSVTVPPAKPEQQSKAEEGLHLFPVAYSSLFGWEDDQIGEVLPALRKSCDKVKALPAMKQLGPSGVGGYAGEWEKPCRILTSLQPNDHEGVRSFFEQYFQPFLASNPATEYSARGLFTGYFEIGLSGSRKKTARYSIPLLKRPSDLVMVDLGQFRDEWKGQRTAGRINSGRLVPYEDRAAIEDGALKHRNLELVWVDDPVGAFFLHIQGSGRISFEDGTVMRVGYDGQNGHVYSSVGRILIDRGEIAPEKMSMQAIANWMRAHPKEGEKLRRANPSYVFFRQLDGSNPIGAQGVELTPGRSLAVDRSYLPLGLPIWLVTTDPKGEAPHLARLLISQDTGGAIKGPVRGDIFWGFGEAAAKLAGTMKDFGSYFLLLPYETVQHCQVCSKIE